MRINIKSIYTCPKCGHPIETWGWHKWKASGFLGRHWPCKNCGMLLEIHPWNNIWFPIYLCAIFLYLWIGPATPFHFALFTFSFVVGSFLATIFLFPIVEKSATEYIPRVMKSISECPKCGHLVGLRHRWNTFFCQTWPCKNCSTRLGFRYWKSAIFMSFVVVLLCLWGAPHVRLSTAILFALPVLFVGIMLANMFCNPIVEKGARQKSDSD